MPLILNGDTGISGVDGTAGTPSLQGTDSNTGVFYATDIVGIATGGSERMRIDSAGQVGVGVTPNTWSTGRVVEVGVSGTSLWGLSSGTSYVTAGYYFNSTDKFALTGNYAIFSQLVPSDGSFRWRASTATGTAGNDATMETNLTLTQGGTLVLKNGNTAATGIGITFPATQSASGNANTLDDYEEGSWTPTLTFSTPGNLSVTYSIQAGRYIKIGRQVTIICNVETSSFTHTTASGSFFVTGLPFTSVNVSSLLSNGAVSAQGWTLTTDWIVVQVSNNDTRAYFQASRSATNLDNLTANDVKTATLQAWRFTITYFTVD